MLNEPGTQDLLTEARQVLLDSLAPSLTGEQKYQSLMIANVLGMAIREIEQRQLGAIDQADQALSEFLSGTGVALDKPEQAEQALAQGIREGRLDGADPGLRSVLKQITEARLSVNNPGFLK